MFPPLSLRAPCGGFNVDVGFFARVPQPDDALYDALLRDVELQSAPPCSARRHGGGAPCDDPMLRTSSSLPAIMPIWSSAGPTRRGSTGVASLVAGCGHGSCYSELGWRTACSPSCPRSSKHSWYVNIWIPMQGRNARRPTPIILS